jgi:hypothetical protein
MNDRDPLYPGPAMAFALFAGLVTIACLFGLAIGLVIPL